MTNALFTIQQAAEYLGVSVAWLSRRDADRPVRYKYGGKVRYSVKDLDVWVEAHREAETTWDSTENEAAITGGSDSNSTVVSTGDPRARQIAEKLRSRLGGNEQCEKPRHLISVDEAEDNG